MENTDKQKIIEAIIENTDKETIINIYMGCPNCCCQEKDKPNRELTEKKRGLPPRDFNPLKKRKVYEGYVKDFDFEKSIVD